MRTRRAPLTRVQQALLLGCTSVVISVLLALLAEGAVRVRQWIKYGSMGTVEDTYTTDAATGLRIPIPNLARGGIRINSLGFRSPELAQPKPPDVIRVAFLGASTTYCAEVSSNEATWPHLVWQNLARQLPGVRFDYVNAGVPGYGYDAILRNLEVRVRALGPDVIVIYEASNDLSADTRELARQRGLFTAAHIQDSWLARHSLLWFLAEKNLRVNRLQASVDDATGKLDYEPRELSRGFEARLRRTVQVSETIAPVVAVATFSSRLRRGLSREELRHGAVTALYYMPYMTLDGLVAGFEEYNRVIRAVAQERRAILIGDEDLIPPDEANYADSVHFTDAGSRLMAARVSSALLASPEFRRIATKAKKQTP